MAHALCGFSCTQVCLSHQAQLRFRFLSLASRKELGTQEVLNVCFQNNCFFLPTMQAMTLGYNNKMTSICVYYVYIVYIFNLMKFLFLD